MPNTGILMLGGLALLWLARGQNGGGQTPRSLASLLNADMSSSGSSSFGGNADNLEPPTIMAVISGDTPYTKVAAGAVTTAAAIRAMAVDSISGIPAAADTLVPQPKEIVGTLSALFEAQGVTVSELSGNAVRQVGLMSRFDSPPLSTANSPSVAFIDITTPAGGVPVLLEEDTPIEVLAPIGGGAVVTIQGNDETTVVTSGINLTGASYFSTPGTIIEAINQGYFDPRPEYVPRSWQQIEADAALVRNEATLARLMGQTSTPDAGLVVATIYEAPVDYATGLDWI
jgi:hypothetical protein